MNRISPWISTKWRFGRRNTKSIMPLLFSHFRLLLPAATLWVMPATAAEPKVAAPTAPQILERLAQTYGSAQTYRDTGVVKTVFIARAIPLRRSS